MVFTQNICVILAFYDLRKSGANSLNSAASKAPCKSSISLRMYSKLNRQGGQLFHKTGKTTVQQNCQIVKKALCPMAQRCQNSAAVIGNRILISARCQPWEDDSAALFQSPSRRRRRRRRRPPGCHTETTPEKLGKVRRSARSKI